MGKGERANRISFSAFNQEGHRGVDAYVQERVTPGLWIHIAGVAAGERIHRSPRVVTRHASTTPR